MTRAQPEGIDYARPAGSGLSVTEGRRLGTRAACPAGCAASVPVAAFPGDVIQAQARSWRPGCRSCAAGTGRAGALLPTGPAGELVTALLCTTMWITCVKRRRACAYTVEMLGIRLPGRARNRAFTWESAIRTLCIGKNLKLSTRHAAIADK